MTPNTPIDLTRCSRLRRLQRAGCVAECGYSIVDHFHTAGALELAHRGWKANLMKMPRRSAFALRPDLAVRLLGGYSLMVLAR